MQIISYNFSVFCIEWKFRDYTKNKEFFRRRNIMFRFFQPEKTNDAHYTKKEDAQNHEILLCIQTGKKITEEDRMKFPTDDAY